MAAPFPSLTETWHTRSYAAISPKRRELTAQGKTVVITGGGTGIGARMAHAFATAGSTKIAIMGRREQPLRDTAQTLKMEFPAIQIISCQVDVRDKTQVDEAFSSVAKSFGAIDIFLSNAGYVTSGNVPVSELDVDDTWMAFETHVKGCIHVAQAFSRTANKSSAVVVDTSSIVAVLPPWPGAAGYTASKLAASKIWEFFSLENPDIRVVSIQPGQIETDMAKKIGLTGVDDVDLPAHFCVWLASPEAHFLDGKYVCANWDVDELKAREAEYLTSDFGTIRLDGLPRRNT